MQSPNHSSPRIKRNSFTPVHGATSPRSSSTRSCGSKAITIADGDTPH
jgi:hypothetical protein